MTRNRSLVAHIGLCLLGALAAGAMGCEGGGGDNSFRFVGRVYNGASGEQLTSYKMSLMYWDQIKEGKIDPTGRFSVGDLPEGNDYTINIELPGYRAFQSHNGMLMIEDFEEVAKLEKITGEQRTLYFDAYLFPDDLITPTVTFSVVLENNLQPPDAQMRLRPKGSSYLYNDAAETPAGVARQIWGNDMDLQSDVLDLPVSAGSALAEEGKLVYGVTYTVDIFGIPDYDNLIDEFTAGVDTAALFTVFKSDALSPTLIYNSAASGAPTYAAEVSFVFDTPIEFDVSFTGYAEAIDDAFRINSTDNAPTGYPNQNTLKVNVSSAVQERGTSIAINGNVLTMKWDQAIGLATTDPADTINSIEFRRLDLIHLRPVGGQASDSFLLSSKVHSNTVTVVLVPPSVWP